MSEELDTRRKLTALSEVVRYRPTFALGVVGLSIVTAVLEGIGLSFILPIIEHARGGADSDPGGIMGAFVWVYDLVGVPFTLEFIVLGVGLVMTVRYVLSFVVAWLRVALQVDYVRHLRTESFQGALDAEIAYFDEHGSDDIINAIITQSNYAGPIIERIVALFQIGLVSLVYFAIAMYMAPILTLVAALILGLSTVVSRNIFESGVSVGDRIAEANKRIQQSIQDGTQGIRDVKLYGMTDEVFGRFENAMDQFVSASVKNKRNSAGINNFHQLVAALSVFALIYLGLTYAELSVGSLGVFLFAIFRLSPRVSNLNDIFYAAESDLPHLVRTQEFIAGLESQSETGESGTKPAPEVDRLAFDDVSFSYDSSEQVLRNVSFEAEAGDFVAFVGQSGAGKSTIVSLVAGLYRPDSGAIRANGTPISEFDIESWRERVAVVRQQPFIFNDTLRSNITIGKRGATEDEVRRVAEIAHVDEFLDELPNGYDTVLGDDGVRLSGGQKQRVSIARALLKDADVLVLDEATSELDTNIEADVQEAIESVERDYIMITIAHRLSTVRGADVIHTVVDGEITESGTHEVLVENGGKYAELYSA